MERTDDLTSEAIEVMRQGGMDVVKSAIAKWWSGKYGRDIDPQPHITRWRAIGDKVAQLAREMNQQHDGR